MPQRKTPAQTNAWILGAHKAMMAAFAIATCGPSSDHEAELYAQFDRLALGISAGDEPEYRGFAYAVAAVTWHAFSISGQPGALDAPQAEPKVRELLAQAQAAPTLHAFIKTVAYPDDRKPVSIDYGLRACVEALRAELYNWDEEMPRWEFLGTIASLVTRAA